MTITLSGTAASFVGNGDVLSRVGGVFATVGSDGSFNNGDINGFRFRISFFDSVDAYLADPFGQSLTDGSSLHIFDAPTNADFLTPVATNPDGFELLFWEFDVESLGIQTTAGETQLVLIQPEIGGGEGGAGIALSTGGLTAVGDSPHFFRSEVTDIGPGLRSELLPDSPPFAAYLVETVAVPEPSSMTLLFVSLLAYASKSCRVAKRY